MSRPGKGRVIDQSGGPGGGPSSGREEGYHTEAISSSRENEREEGWSTFFSICKTEKPVVVQLRYHSKYQAQGWPPGSGWVGRILIQERRLAARHRSEPLMPRHTFASGLFDSNGDFKNQSFSLTMVDSAHSPPFSYEEHGVRAGSRVARWMNPSSPSSPPPALPPPHPGVAFV